MKFWMAAAVAAGASLAYAAPVDSQAEHESLRAAATAYYAAATAKDRDGVVAFYDVSALMVPPNAPRVEGLDAVRGYRFGFIETPGVSLEFETIRSEMSPAGDWGWTLALGDVTFVQADGQPGHDLVQDFHVWRKTADGSWKITVDMWNSGVN